MSYRRILIGDVNVARFWQPMQAARPQLKEVAFKHASCLDTLETALDSVSDEHDYAVVSMVTSVLVEDGSAMDVRGSSVNALEASLKRIIAASKRSMHCQVWCFIFFI